MRVRVHFYSYFKELTGASELVEEVAPGCPLCELRRILFSRFPKLVPLEKSCLAAVGVDYQPDDYILMENDEVSLFPPVQGG